MKIINENVSEKIMNTLKEGAENNKLNEGYDLYNALDDIKREAQYIKGAVESDGKLNSSEISEMLGKLIDTIEKAASYDYE